jgi:hypothetical protein
MINLFRFSDHRLQCRNSPDWIKHTSGQDVQHTAEYQNKDDVYYLRYAAIDISISAQMLQVQ